jgi:transketolase
LALEAVKFSDHQQLDNLILIYDSNAVPLDAMGKQTRSRDAAKHFEALTFDLETADGASRAPVQM